MKWIGCVFSFYSICHTRSVNHIDYRAIYCRSSKCLTSCGNTYSLIFGLERFFSDDGICSGAFSVPNTAYQNYVFDRLWRWRQLPTVSCVMIFSHLKNKSCISSVQNIEREKYFISQVLVMLVNCADSLK